MNVFEELRRTSFMRSPGAYVLVDGQYGSTGKGLVSAVLVEAFDSVCAPIVTTSAGPNSGHTSYYGGAAHILTQLPTYTVQKALRNPAGPQSFRMNAGSVIDPTKFVEELERYPNITALVHPNATIITDEMKQNEQGLTARLGSTAKGTGAAIAAKVMRETAVAKQFPEFWGHPQIRPLRFESVPRGQDRYMVEVSQGFSLGINQRFYPFCTSRECTVGQGLSDAGLAPDLYQGAIQVVRTYPIRVAGNSGPCYSDQYELDWDHFDVEPERTTVTKKIRRIFTWSRTQYIESLVANRPNIIFLNFCNYLQDEGEVNSFVSQKIHKPYVDMFGKAPELILLGHGPKIEDVTVWGGVPF